jgi:molybdopterin molybdotransferase
VLGLPGNPVSALVTWELFGRPAVRRLAGRQAVHNPTVPVRLAAAAPSKAGLTHFLRITLAAAADGIPGAQLTGPQGSGILTSVARADALLVVPESSDGFDAGALARAMPLPPRDAAVATLDL